MLPIKEGPAKRALFGELQSPAVYRDFTGRVAPFGFIDYSSSFQIAPISGLRTNTELNYVMSLMINFTTTSITQW